MIFLYIWMILSQMFPERFDGHGFWWREAILLPPGCYGRIVKINNGRIKYTVFGRNIPGPIGVSSRNKDTADIGLDSVDLRRTYSSKAHYYYIL